MTSPTLLGLVKKHKRIYIIGNGGSYANAVHICNDLLAVGVKAYTLDPATLTASANDFGYQTVFSRWIKVCGEKTDLLIALSGSGQSKNIIKGIQAAKRKGMTTACIIGTFSKEPVRAKMMCHHSFAAGPDMQSAEQWQLRFGHEVYLALKK